MILNERTESNDLLMMRSLNARMELSFKEKNYYNFLEKGYEGEVKYDQLLPNLQGEHYIINDLLLEVNNSLFQIDSLIISQDVIHLIDVKNHEGDYYLESDKLLTVSNKREYKNPIIQLKRCETLFRQLLQTHKFNFLTNAKVVFINDEFTLYQATMDLPIIFPTQVNKFIKTLSDTPSKLNDSHKQLAQKLLSLHLPKNPYNSIPPYDYHQLTKGILCVNCFSFANSVKGKLVVCNKCGHKESVTDAVLRSVKEYKLLFPDKITTNCMFEWCKVLPKRTIRYLLQKNLTIVGSRQWAYYE